jgi:hypothetical protein
MRTKWGAVLLLVSCLGFHPSAKAQGELPTRVTAQNRVGDLPFSTTIGTDIESVDVASGNLSVKIPILSLPGRGMPLQFFLRFNSKILVAANRADSMSNPFQIWNVEANSGWQTSSIFHTFAFQQVQCIPQLGGGKSSYDTNQIYTDPSGAKHPLAVQVASGGTCGYSDLQGPDLTGSGISGHLSSQNGGVVLYPRWYFLGPAIRWVYSVGY